jgi:hypothetical protein
MGNATSHSLPGFFLPHDLQGPLDTLGLHHYPETRGAASHLNRDPYHPPTPSFCAKIEPIVTFQLYVTILTVSSEDMLEIKEFRTRSARNESRPTSTPKQKAKKLKARALKRPEAC